MNKGFRDILRESLQSQALSGSFEAKMNELDILIDAHEKNLEAAKKAFGKAKDSAEQENAANDRIREMEILIPLYLKKKELMEKMHSAAVDDSINNINYDRISADQANYKNAAE